MLTPSVSWPALVLALLIGGVSASFAVAWAVRRPDVREALATAEGSHLTVVALAMTGAGIIGAGWTVRALLRQLSSGFGTVGPFQMLVLGVSIGLPFAVPGVLAAWSEARHRHQTAIKRRDYVPTKDDRRAFAARLVDQIREVSPPREVTASISGDGGTVLVLEGELDASEGERLTAALREDLQVVGFRRVEGRTGTREWWTRV